MTTDVHSCTGGELVAEVGVVGAGPAGARLAERLAAQGFDVIVWDPKAPWEKPCGGGLTAAALAEYPELTELGGRLQLIHRVRLRTAGGAEVEIPLEQPLGIVSRRELACWQLERARAAGATVCREGVRELKRAAEGGWRVLTRDGSSRRVRYLVGADGAASFARAAAAPELKVALEPTRVAYVTGVGDDPETITVWFTPGVTGYAWDFPRPNHRSVGAVAAPGGRTRAELDADTDACGQVDSRRVTRRTGAVIGTALHHRPSDYPAIAGPDLALIGDAAGLVDPSTGEGLRNAFRSAAAAADALTCHRSFLPYGRWVSEHLEPEFRVARRLRQVLYARSAVVRLIEMAVAHRSARSLLTVLVNGVNGHQARALASWARMVW